MSKRRSSARISDESAVYGESYFISVPKSRFHLMHLIFNTIVARSPVSSSKQNTNLTGNARIANDLISDICNSITLWNEKVTEGSQYVDVIGRVISDSG